MDVAQSELEPLSRCAVGKIVIDMKYHRITAPRMFAIERTWTHSSPTWYVRRTAVPPRLTGLKRGRKNVGGMQIRTTFGWRESLDENIHKPLPRRGCCRMLRSAPHHLASMCLRRKNAKFTSLAEFDWRSWWVFCFLYSQWKTLALLARKLLKAPTRRHYCCLWSLRGKLTAFTRW